MKVITISRLLNSGGRTIGQQVADELGYYFVTKETIEKIMDQYGIVEFSSMYESKPGFLDRMDNFQEEMIDFLTRVMQALAVHGNVVILGRGGFAVFPDYSDVLNIRLWAPLEERVSRLMQKENYKTRLDATHAVLKHDKIRKAFVERWFHSHPDRNNAFDLSVNTAKMPQESIVRMIVDTAKIRKDLVLEGHKTLSSLDVDPILLNTVEEILGA